MKVEPAPRAFTPITITLETLEEYTEVERMLQSVLIGAGAATDVGITARQLLNLLDTARQYS